MLTFIILETNNNVVKKIEKIINNYMMCNKLNYVVNVYKEETKELKDKIKDGNSKIYLLNSINSKELTKKIRKYDWTSSIILLKKDINDEANYKRLLILDTILIDNKLEDNLRELFELCLKQFRIKNNVVIKKKAYDYRLCVSEILYIYKDKRKTVIVTDNNRLEVFDNLKYINGLLNNSLTQIHKSCYVNMARIEMIDRKNLKVIFDNKMSCELVSPLYLKRIKK